MSDEIIPVYTDRVDVYYDAKEKYYFATIMIQNKSITLKEIKSRCLSS